MLSREEKDFLLKTQGYYETDSGVRIYAYEVEAELNRLKAKYQTPAAPAAPKTDTVAKTDTVPQNSTDKYVVHHHNVISKAEPQPKSKTDKMIEDCFKGCDPQIWGGVMQAMKNDNRLALYEDQVTRNEHGGVVTRRVRV